MGMDEESHPIVCISLIQEFQAHKSDFMAMYVSEEHFNNIMNDLFPLKKCSGTTYKGGWLTSPGMSHIVGNFYNLF